MGSAVYDRIHADEEKTFVRGRDFTDGCGGIVFAGAFADGAREFGLHGADRDRLRGGNILSRGAIPRTHRPGYQSVLVCR